MNKTELTKKLSQKTGLSQEDCKTVQEALLETIQESLVSKEKVTLTGFGTFDTKVSKARKGRNPATGEEMLIPAKRRVSFRVGKTLKDSVEGAN